MSMKSAVDAKAFAEGLRKVSKVLERSSGIPCLSEVLVQFQGSKCTLTGTNIRAWVTLEMPAAGDEFSCLLCRSKDVERACRYLNGTLEMELAEVYRNKQEQYRLTLRCGSRTAEFDAMPSKDYPQMMEFEVLHEITLDTEKLLDRVERVSYAADKPGQNARESNTCVQFKDNQIFALDGHRLACDFNDSMTFPAPFLIDSNAASLLKLLEGKEVTLQYGKRYARFHDETVSLLIRTAECMVFELEKAVPKDFKNEFLVSPSELLAELDFLKKSAPETSKPYVRFRDGELFMPVGGSKFYSSVHITGTGDIPFACDLRYMKDALRQFKNEELVRIKTVSTVAPVIIEAESRSDFALICPVRFRDELEAA